LWISSVIAQSLRSKPKERNYRNKFKTQKMGVERFLIPSVWNWMKNISNWMITNVMQYFFVDYFSSTLHGDENSFC
jgi:hypothetical protein